MTLPEPYTTNPGAPTLTPGANQAGSRMNWEGVHDPKP